MHPCTILAIIFPIIVVAAESAETSDMWRRAGRMTGLLLNKCLWTGEEKDPSPERSLFILRECLQRRGLKVLYKAIGEDNIEVVEGVELVKYKESNFTSDERSLVLSRSYNEEFNWKERYLEAVKQLFNTHVLKIKLKYLDEPITEARGRRRQNMFSQLMMFGVIAAAFIVIPMGFQFLAILGGKALLLAKMALLLSSIQGLKKIATSNFNYGLYSYGRQDPWQYDRQWPYDGVEGQRGPNYNSYEGYDYLQPRIDPVKQ